MQRIFIILLGTLGALEALLLARLVLGLLAARPENPIFSALFALTAPLLTPLAALDAGQPRFGAVMELSTIALCTVVAAIILLLVFAARRTPEKSVA